MCPKVVHLLSVARMHSHLCKTFLSSSHLKLCSCKSRNLRDVVMSHQAKKHAEWKRAQNVFVRQSASLTLEEKELLQDWQFILRDMSTLESVALLPGLQRCFHLLQVGLPDYLTKLAQLHHSHIAEKPRTKTSLCFLAVGCGHKYRYFPAPRSKSSKRLIQAVHVGCGSRRYDGEIWHFSNMSRGQ